MEYSVKFQYFFFCLFVFVSEIDKYTLRRKNYNSNLNFVFKEIITNLYPNSVENFVDNG